MPLPHPHSPCCPNLCSVPCDPGHFATAWPGWTPDPKVAIQGLASGPLTSVLGAVGWAGRRVSLRRWEMERLPGWARTLSWRPWGWSGPGSPWSQTTCKIQGSQSWWGTRGDTQSLCEGHGPWGRDRREGLSLLCLQLQVQASPLSNCHCPPKMEMQMLAHRTVDMKIEESFLNESHPTSLWAPRQQLCSLWLQSRRPPLRNHIGVGMGDKEEVGVSNVPCNLWEVRVILVPGEGQRWCSRAGASTLRWESVFPNQEGRGWAESFLLGTSSWYFSF